MKHLDCRGLACPGPVIQVKKTLQEVPAGGSFTIDLDSEASVDNVLRFARGRGAQVQVGDRVEEATRLIITKPSDTETRRHGDAGEEAVSTPEARGSKSGPREPGLLQSSPPVIFITSDVLGDGDEKLGRILMEGFFTTLTEQEQAPDKILLMNAGVKLAVEESEVIEALRRLTDRGCEILVCGTCLEFFSLSDRLLVGTVSNMYDIQGALLEAGSVIKI